MIERGQRGPLKKARIEQALEAMGDSDQLAFMVALADWDRFSRKLIRKARHMTGVLDAIGVAYACGFLTTERCDRLKAYVENMGKEELNGRYNEAD